jgi:hypothetical protein
MDKEQAAQLLEILEQQRILIASLTKNPMVKKEDKSTEFLLESLSKSISDFTYDPTAGMTFDIWFARYEDLFEFDCENLDDAAKVRLLLRKLNTLEHDKYTSYILPAAPREFKFADTVTKLKKLFGRTESIFNTRYKCLQVTKEACEDFVSYASKVNKLCEDFKLSTLTANQFKSLIYVIGLQSQQDAEIRTKILSKIDSDEGITIDKIVQECLTLINLKHDTNLVGNKSENSNVNFVSKGSKKFNSKHPGSKPQSPSGSKPQSTHDSNKVPRRPCWQCGKMHYVKDCKYSDHFCKDCKNKGHKEGYCSCFKRSTTAQNISSPLNKKYDHKDNTKRVGLILNVNNVQSNRKFVNVEINSMPVVLQIDTASDITIISKDTWERIGKPELSPSTQTATDASANIIKFHGEFNCEIELNSKKQWGKCLVSNNSNINLLGIDFINRY